MSSERRRTSTTAADERIFHRGELAVQQRLGVLDSIGPWAAKVVRPSLPDQHREFYSQLPFLVVAARDAQGRPWATVLAGDPGFARAPDATRLQIDTRPVSGDALEEAIEPGAPLGILGIELATRRRNRVSGTLRNAKARDAGAPVLLELEVEQCFGNCPQYIREREWTIVRPTPSRPVPRRSKRLDASLRRRIESADTFFIATGHPGQPNAPSHGMDASHRGGAAGFVRVEGTTRLSFPDFAGNNHFNTIGNLEVDPRAGLLFVDFERGGMLQLTGRAIVDFDSPEIENISGAQRMIHFELDEAIDLPCALPIRWRDPETELLTLDVVDKIRESDDVASFVLASCDDRPLPNFAPGQHLPVQLSIESELENVRRTYSLSNGPGEGRYRISVKREAAGLASRHLHDQIEVGARIESHAPAGDFVLEPGDRPIVLMSAGVGVTPMVSMLRALVRARDPRRISFVHVARDGRHHPLAEEVRNLIAAAPNATGHISYTRPRPEDDPGRDFDAAGRLDAGRLDGPLSDPEADFYLCGPVPFMAEIARVLLEKGVSPEHVRSESFGPMTTR